MLCRVGTFLIILMSLLVQISGWKVEWEWVRPEGFAMGTVAKTVGHNDFDFVGYGTELKCNPNYFLIVCKINGSRNLFLAAFLQRPDGGFDYYKLVLTRGKLLVDQIFPNHEALKAALTVPDNTLQAASGCVSIFGKNFGKDGCYSLDFAVSVAMDSWLARIQSE